MRLMSDLREMNADASEGISASPASEANIFIWNASIIGPNESPWEGIFVSKNFLSLQLRCFPGGIFQLKLTFSDDYPGLIDLHVHVHSKSPLLNFFFLPS